MDKPEPPEWTQSFRVSPDEWSGRLAVDSGQVYTLRAKARSTIWEFLFGDVEVIPGTINPPTEPSGVRVDAAITAANASELPWDYPDDVLPYRRFNFGVNRYEVQFTNEGAVDRPNFTAQFFVNLNELHASETPVDDVFVELVETDACKATLGGLEAWNEDENSYYVTIDLRRHGLAVGESCRVAFEIVGFYRSTDAVDHAEDYGLSRGNYYSYYYADEPYMPERSPVIPLTAVNDFSAQGLGVAPTTTDFIPIFDGDVMIGGTLPPVQPILPTLVGLGTAVSKSPMAQMKLAVIGVSMVLLMSGAIAARKRVKDVN